MAYNNPFRRSVTRNASKTAPLLPISQPRATEFKERRPASGSNRESSRENLSLEIIYDPHENGYPGEPDFDIIVVHGLLELPEDTWTWHRDVSYGAPDNNSSHRQQGLSSFVQDVLSPLSNTSKRPALRHQTSQNEERQGQDLYTRKSKKARRKKRSRVNWLKDPDMLPNSFPHARIMSFNYDWEKGSTTFQIRNSAAYRLLKALAEDRRDVLRFPPRPIVFIGHSFGGVVIQTALVLADQEKFVPDLQRNNDRMWQNRKKTQSEILKATVGVIFLATPFKITKSIREHWAKAGVYLDSSGTKTSEQQTMMQEKGSASNLKAIKVTDQFNLDFLYTTREEQFRLACFYEKHPRSSKESPLLDMDSSTLPGYPKIPLVTRHTGMSKFSSENDPSYRVVVDAIKGFLEFAPTRQMWKAISIGRFKNVQTMLELGADPNLQDVQGESSLHKAVRCEKNTIRVLERLLSRGADINLQDVEQKTALSIAESECKDKIALFLRRKGAVREFWNMRRIGNEHPLDKIYMDGPSHSPNIASRWEDVLDSNCEDACHRSILSITHFNQCANGTLNRYRSKTSIFDALYDKDSSKEIIWNALTKYQEANGMKTKPASFTWYHLPANNMAWVEKLFTILFKDWFKKDATETIRVLRSLSGEQHRLNSSNFLYMRPDCKIVDLRFEVEQKVGLKLFMPYLHYEKSSTQAEMRKWMDQSTKSYDRREIFKRKPSETTLAITIDRPNTGITDSAISTSSSQESEQEDESKLAPQSSPEAKGIFGEFISKYKDDPPEQYLISGYLNKEPPLHIRRSLDQFYSISKQDDMIDSLDMDQVVYKHFDKKMPKRKMAPPSASRTGSWETETMISDSHENVHPQAKHSANFQELLHRWERKSKATEEYPIVIVDQLWLWIIDGDTIITSFPQPCESSPNDILERIEEKLKAPDVKNIGDLASLIMDECAGFLDRCRAPENIAILDIYDETISDAMKQQVEFFDEFTETVLISLVREDYHNFRKDGTHLGMEQELRDKYEEKAGFILSADIDQKPLSILQEAELLREIRDAKEELNIIKRILEQQERVIEKGFKPLATRPKDNEAVKKFNGGSMSAAPVLVECRHNHERNAETIISTIQNSLRSVKAMLERGDEVCDGLKTLLDLKQKEINVQEARATRQIAQGNEKQSKIILIFTSVTILFMPLSFLASFFALNIDGFPRDVDGGVKFGLSWVSCLIFGVTTVFVVPFAIGAFFYVAPSGRKQARNLLRQIFNPFTLLILWLTASLEERKVAKASRRRRSTSSEATRWNTVTYEIPSFD